MSRADVEASRSLFGALLGGARAAVEFGELLNVEESSADLYVSRAAFAELKAKVVLVADPLGSVAVRVVEDEAWKVIDGSPAEIDGLAPRNAVVLDLLESGDPRHWLAAERLASNL
jgi:hypothetical protein